MSNKPHPLDIFRSSEQGFTSASRMPRKRRTVSGKVVRSVARASAKSASAAQSRRGSAAQSRSGSAAPGSGSGASPSRRRGTAAKPAPATLSRSKARATAPPPPARTTSPKRKPAKQPGKEPSPRLLSSRILAGAALAIVAVLMTWVWVGGDAGDDSPSLRKEAVFSAGGSGSDEAPTSADALTTAPAETTAAAQPAPPATYTIRAATYGGSAMDLVKAAANELKGRGFGDVDILGWPDGKGGYERLELVVGLGKTKGFLDETLVALRAIDDWGSGRKSKPFDDALVIAHPGAAGTHE